MHYLKNGDIIPRKGIGALTLDMNLKQVQNILKEFEIENLDSTWLLKAGDVHVWVLKEEDIVDQIMVFGDFKGKYAGLIGIGSTLGDVKNHLDIGWHEVFDTTVLDDVPGMSFVFADDAFDDWDEQNEAFESYELRAPIGYICVYLKEPDLGGIMSLSATTWCSGPTESRSCD